MLRRAAPLVAAGALALGVSACGSGGSHGSASGGPSASGDPTTLLRQTFASTHAIKSGVLAVTLVITPKGSSVLTAPLSLSLFGPFQSSGDGHPSEAALTIGFSGLGKHGTLGLTTTASGGYVTLGGTSYRLPNADSKKLRNSLAARSGTGSPGLSSFGINPESWVSRPRIVGTATIDGVVTEHLHANVNIRALVLSLAKVLARESSTLRSAGAGAGVGAPRVPAHITAAQASKIAAAIHQPTVDVYADKSDSTLRRLVIGTTLPVRGATSGRLGGLSAAQIRLTIGYSHVNEPQTITAPAHAQSFTALQSRIEAFGRGLAAGGFGNLGAAGAGSSTAVSKYARCVQKADGNVAKMQRCASLLQNAG